MELALNNNNRPETSAHPSLNRISAAILEPAWWCNTPIRHVGHAALFVTSRIGYFELSMKLCTVERFDFSITLAGILVIDIPDRLCMSSRVSFRNIHLISVFCAEIRLRRFVFR